MAEEQEGQKERNGGKGRLLAFLAAALGALAVLAFWRRRRRASEE